MKKIIKEHGSVYCNEGAWEAFKETLVGLEPSSVFVLTDDHTRKDCLPYFEQMSGLTDYRLLTIASGETHKTIETCLKVWQELSQRAADRHSILINLGGGVVTDLGGFVACTYQRGISFINIPTSLLSMVDASVGGKNGVDLGTLKNQIGIIKNPQAVIIDTHFLKTLPKEHLRSGMAEMIKHGFISSEDYLERVFRFDIHLAWETEQLIWESIAVKNQIITEDPTEKGLRKTLNYGHTLGHAIESYCLEQDPNRALLHGEAIAVGMVLATYLSHKLYGFPLEVLQKYSRKILQIFPKPSFSGEDIEEIIKLLSFDKKNRKGKVQFVLLESIGKYHLNCEVPNEKIHEAFKFFENFSTE